MKFASIALLGAALVASAAFAGCNDDDDDDGDVAPAATTAPAATAPAAATAATGGDETITITAQDIAYSTAAIELALDEPTTIVLDNRDQVPHTITIYEDQDFTEAVPDANTGQVAAGSQGEIEVTLDDAEQHFFRCEVHPGQMQGVINVN